MKKLRNLLAVVLLVLSTQTLALPTIFDEVSNLSFTPPITNVDGTPLLDLAGYKVYYKSAIGDEYTDTNSKQFLNPTLSLIQLKDLVIADGSYYVVITAVDTSSNESAFSNEVTVKKTGGKYYKNLNASSVPAAPSNLKVQ